MFRVAALRTAARAATAQAPRMTARTLVTAAAKPSAFRVAPKFGMAVRMYSAGGALDKKQVEGRIMSLLQGFDKVRLSPTGELGCG